MSGYIAIIAAAGKSTRTGAKAERKQFTSINGKPVLWHAAQPFLRHLHIAQVRVIVDDAAAAKLAAAMFDDARVIVMDCGGDTRAQTVANGIDGISPERLVIIHDAARPCLTDESLGELITAAEKDDNGALLAIPAGDALKRSFIGKAHKTLSRNNKWRAQTPQAFRAGLLLPALRAHIHAADDSAAMEKAGYRPHIVRGRSDNIKITDADDMQLAAAILSARLIDGNKPATTKPATKASTKPATKKTATKKPSTKPAAKKKPATKKAAKTAAKGRKK